jgi:hypothetical protein
MRELEVNLSKWGENNVNVGEAGLIALSQAISALKSLELLDLNMEQ